MREEFHSVGDPGTFGLGKVTLAVLVVFHSWSHVETSAGMFRPSAPLPRSIMYNNLASWGSQWGLIVVKVSMDHSVCRQFGFDPGGSEKIQTDDCLGYE